MNCHQFKLIIKDRPSLASPGEPLPHDALAHADSCPACAVLLSADLHLAEAMRSLRIGTSAAEAPPQIESALRSAFLRQFGQSIPVATPRRWWFRWPAEIAAVLVLATLVALWRFSQAPSSPPEMTTASQSAPASESAPAIATANPALPLPQKMPTPLTQSSAMVANSIPPVSEHIASEDLHSVSTVLSTQPPRAGIVSGATAHTARMTSFVPLYYPADPLLLGAGPVVRIVIPAAALEAMGFQIQTEVSRDSFQADVLLGEDGMARAIRLIY